MLKKCVVLASALFAFWSLALAGEGTWTGVVSDDHCNAKHSAAGDAAAECVTKCVSGGAKFVLVSGGKVYQLEPQDKFAGLGGKAVKVTGMEDGGTIAAASVEPSQDKSRPGS